jgi:hypothetical protein
MRTVNFFITALKKLSMISIGSSEFSNVVGLLVGRIFRVCRGSGGASAHGSRGSLRTRLSLGTRHPLEAGGSCFSLVTLDTGLFLIFEVDILDGKDDGGDDETHEDNTKDGERDNFKRNFFDERRRCHFFFILWVKKIFFP